MTLIILSTYALLLLLIILLIREKIKHTKTKAELRVQKMVAEIMQERAEEYEGNFNELLESWAEDKV